MPSGHAAYKVAFEDCRHRDVSPTPYRVLGVPPNFQNANSSHVDSQPVSGHAEISRGVAHIVVAVQILKQEVS